MNHQAGKVDPEVNYSTILCDGMSKWRANHLVEDFQFDIYSGFTRLSIDFRKELVASDKIALGAGAVTFDYDETRLSVAWKDRDERGWRYALKPEGIDPIELDNMIGYLNHPLGALVTITEEFMARAMQCSGPVALPYAPHISLKAAHLERVGGHRDVSTFLFTKSRTGMTLDIKLEDHAQLPVVPDVEGNRMLSFGFSPDALTLSWGAGPDQMDKRGWTIDEIGQTRMEREIMPDLMSFAYETITGDREADFRGKSSNPVWKLIKMIEPGV